MSDAAILVPAAVGSLFLLAGSLVIWRDDGLYEATGPMISGALCFIVTAIAAIQLC